MSTPLRVKKHLYDVAEAILAIESYTRGLDESRYLANDMIQAAVERKFEIIGEALNRVGRENEEILTQITDHQRIIGFRNIIAHGYDIIDPRLVWDAIQNHLPILKSEVDQLLGQ